MSKNKTTHIEKTLKEIRKKFGEESIMIMGANERANVETFPSGSYLLDKALGIGGYPKGRIIEIFGTESSGKTTLALHAIASIQKLGGIAAFIDVEHALDPKYAKNLGVDIDNLILSQPDSGEQALEIADTLVKTGEIDLVIVDSVAALVPEAELNGEMRDQTIGAQARLMSKALRKMTASINKAKTTVIFINQVREKIGIIFGNPEVTPGGRSLKFYSSIRLDVRKSKLIGDSNDYTGHLIKIKVVKNKLSAPFRFFVTEIIFSQGISRDGELIDLGVELNVLTKKGSFYYYKDKKIAQGRVNAKQYLVDNPEFKKELIKELDKFDIRGRKHISKEKS